MSDLNVNPETGESTAGRSPRFTLWIAFLVFSTITLGTAVEVKNDQEDPNSEAKWAVACSALTFSITAAIVVMHLLPVASTLIVGTMLEGVVIIVLVAFWAATVAIVTNADNSLAVSESGTSGSGQVSNANLYYFSWAGFVTSIILMVSYLRSAFGVDLVGEVRNRSARLTLWAGLIATSLVVTGSSSRVWNDDCTPNELFDEKYCIRTKFAISVGAITCVFSLVIVSIKLMSSTPPFLIEFVSAVLLAIMNGFGVAYVTSNSGPGKSIGNLYYFSWGSFLLSLVLAADCFNQFTGGNAGPSTRNNSNDDKQGGGDIEVENMEDQI